MQGVGSQPSIRKALGALKDTTMVGLATLNSEYKELDIAIVKATNHVEHVAKEKHVRLIFEAISASRPRADVAYCLAALARRLAKTHNWAVALKTLIVIHRALREVDPTFREELINFTRSRGHMLNLSHFKDDSSPSAWDFSAWVRMYALYLEEKLECYRILKYDVEMERSRTKELDTVDLLEQLPALQQLLFRLLACQPEGAAKHNNMIQYALSIVASESVKLYTAINDGTLNLVDKFFEMQRHDAVRALEIYKKAGNQAKRLSEFYQICKGLDLLRGQKYIKIEQPPASFATVMEEFVQESSRLSPLHRNLVSDDRSVSPETIKKIEHKKSPDAPEKPEPLPPEPVKNDIKEAPVSSSTDDLLALNDLSQEASTLDEKNSLALAIVTTEDASDPANAFDQARGAAGWELALVGAPSSNGSAITESKLAGGFDKLTLDSLYDDAMTGRTNQTATYHMGQSAPNPFESDQYSQDPFYASSNIPPPANVQMAAMVQQQEAFMLQQQQQMMGGQDATNPFGNPFATPGAPPYQSNNPYNGFI